MTPTERQVVIPFLILVISGPLLVWIKTRGQPRCRYCGRSYTNTTSRARHEQIAHQDK